MGLGLAVVLFLESGLHDICAQKGDNSEQLVHVAEFACQFVVH